MRTAITPSGVTTGSLLDKLDEIVQRRINAIAPFRAIVMDVDIATNKVSIKRTTDSVSSEEYYTRVAGGGVPAIGDEVACIIIGGKPVIIGEIARTLVPQINYETLILDQLNTEDLSVYNINTIVVTYGTGAGTGPTAAVVTGSDTLGTMTFTTGTAPSASADQTVATFTFDLVTSIAFGISLFPNNAQSGKDLECIYASRNSSSAWRMRTTGVRALAASTDYSFTYVRVPILTP